MYCSETWKGSVRDRVASRTRRSSTDRLFRDITHQAADDIALRLRRNALPQQQARYEDVMSHWNPKISSRKTTIKRCELAAARWAGVEQKQNETLFEEETSGLHSCCTSAEGFQGNL